MSLTVALKPHENPRIDTLTYAKRLRWVIEFTQRDLEELPAEGLEAIGDDLLHAAAPWWPHTETSMLLEGEQIRALQQEIRQGIQALLSECIPFSETLTMAVGRNPLKGGWVLQAPATHLFRVRMGYGGIRVLRVGKEKRFDEWRAIVEGVVALIGICGDQLRTCQVCGTPFLRQYRQEYCQVRCSNKVRNKRRLDRQSHQRKNQKYSGRKLADTASLITA